MSRAEGRPVLRRIGIYFLILLLPTVASAATLTRLEPSGAARGSTVEITAIGSFPTWPAKGWVEGKGVSVEPSKEKGKFKVVVAADAVPGPRWFRIDDGDGATSPRPFIIGTLPESNETEPNDSPKQAQALTISSLVMNGKLGKSGDVDVFALSLKKGQTLVAAIDSRAAFGSPMDGVLQIVSPDGFVLAQNDDDSGFDPRIAFTVKRDGKYLVRVFAFPATPDSTIRFAGGDAYVYRLTMTAGPFLDQPMPLAIRAGTKDVLGLGWNLAEKARLEVSPSEEPDFALVSGPTLANTGRVRVVTANVETESEPNDPKNPRPTSLPVSLSGRIDRRGDRDAFRFEAKKGVRLALSVEAKRVRSPLDPTVQVLDPAGKVVYEGDDSDRGGRDLDATFTPTVDGTHQLVITDLHGRGGDRFVYRITLGPQEPDFSLSLAEDRIKLKPGTPTSLKVTVNRLNGFDKPVDIKVAGLPEGVKVAPVVSQPKGDSAKSVTLKFESEKGPAAALPIRVEGISSETPARSRVATFPVTDIGRPVAHLWLSVLAPPPPKPKEEPRAKPKDEPKSTAKADPKAKPKEEPKAKPKDDPKAKPKEEPKAKPKDDPKAKPKEEPKAKPKLAADSEKAETHWAFRPVTRPRIPNDAGHPIDAFINATLASKGRRPAATVDKVTLIRRVTLDLTGLPPTPAEVTGFLNDARPDAYERLVDRLLERPEFGERFARHWLDVVRYAESNGYERDGEKPGVWRYRDYVIRAFNEDRPFGRFLTEQIAGDEMPDATPQTRIATTFLRLGTWDDEPADDLVDRYDQLDDVLGTVSAAFMGLTLRCARCHDHKFEPFSQVEYYKLLAVFEPLRRPQVGRSEFEWPVCSPGELSEIRARMGRDAGIRAGFAIGANVVPRGPVPEIPTAYVWREDGPRPPETRLLKRGDPTRKAEAVSPGVPAALGYPITGEPVPSSVSCGRRLWLARWLSAPENPLTWRVAANRIWQWHFGQGLVASSNDFGTVGESPSHPELLDWLASELIREGGRMKPIHRLIVTSETYRRSAGPAQEDRLYEVFPRRKLEAEVVRDSILAVSGALDHERGGHGVYPKLPAAVLEGQSRPGEGWGSSTERQASRRSIYLFAKRSLAVPELQLLDTPDTTSSCERRPSSTTGPQALTFLNGEFIHGQAKLLAARLIREAGASLEARVGLAFRLALAREPTPKEKATAIEFIKKRESAARIAGRRDDDSTALAAFCLVVLNLNEFVYLP